MDFRQRPQKTEVTGGSLFDSATFKESFARKSAQASPTGRALQSTQKPRSAELIAAIHQIDASIDDAVNRDLADWIRDEYQQQFGSDDIPLGFVAVCYLGPPRVEHQLNLMHRITGHFSAAQPMPQPFQQCRMLVRSGSYEYVEVYASGQTIPIRADGTPVLPTGGGQS